jgi:hypothetical protein
MAPRTQAESVRGGSAALPDAIEMVSNNFDTVQLAAADPNPIVAAGCDRAAPALATIRESVPGLGRGPLIDAMEAERSAPRQITEVTPTVATVRDRWHRLVRQPGQDWLCEMGWDAGTVAAPIDRKCRRRDNSKEPHDMASHRRRSAPSGRQ